MPRFFLCLQRFVCAELPFLRPLVHTYGTLQRDKHFVKLLKGRGFSKVSVEAKEFLMCLFQRKPEKRLTLQVSEPFTQSVRCHSVSGVAGDPKAPVVPRAGPKRGGTP